MTECGVAERDCVGYERRFPVPFFSPLVTPDIFWLPRSLVFNFRPR